MGDRRDTCKVLMEKPEGKRKLGRLRHRQEENTKINLKDLGWGHELD
jgi:hypothetical protein